MTDKEIITCQKSQIEDLKEALEKRMQRIKELEAEVDRLQNHNLFEEYIDTLVKEMTEETDND